MPVHHVPTSLTMNLNSHSVVCLSLTATILSSVSVASAIVCEVQGHSAADVPPPSNSTNTSDAANRDVLSPCADNWKAAAGNEKKHMWDIFDETGIFACACRHGMIVWLADMVRSGELAKYPLAIVSKVLDTLGPRVLLGYDIGCSFQSTVASSSLASRARDQGLRLCVNAFHGYSHSYACQQKHHPNIIPGTGLEDLETLERVFSVSNQLANVTRYASAFRRRLFIDNFFRQWDEDKYQNLGVMLYNNYKQALEIVNTDTIALQEAMNSLNIQEEDFARWQNEEIEYVSQLGTESEENLLHIMYVEMLQKLRDNKSRSQAGLQRFITSYPTSQSSGSHTYSAELSQTRKLETERRHARELHESTLREVIAIEIQLGIADQDRWHPTHPQYLETLKYMSLRRYHQALDKLQKLVVQRLFELHKMNLSASGYRVRTHIAKALQRRCKAIQTALNEYNKAASELNPPRPELDWSEVSHYGFLEEFTLLRETRQDVLSKPWAKPAIREAIKQSHRLKRAHEELDRCNVESRRLLTAILDEHNLFIKILSTLEADNSPFHGAVTEYCTRRRRINNDILHRISQIHALHGFTGNPSYGQQKGASSPSSISTLGVHDLRGDAVDDDNMEGSDSSDDEGDRDMDGLVNFISHLAEA
ncbi:CxC1-like cysteine cluster associated with KDZ transposases domain-containing protein [Pleurotus pulmonarius]